MVLFTAVDQKMGMLFNGRRQSQDRILRERLIRMADGRPVWMDSYSAGQFSEAERGHIRVDEAFLSKAGKGEICFLEKPAGKIDLSGIEKIVLARWDKTYPADTWFDAGLLDGMRLTKTEEFVGYSHDKIVLNTYEEAKDYEQKA